MTMHWGCNRWICYYHHSRQVGKCRVLQGQVQYQSMQPREGAVLLAVLPLQRSKPCIAVDALQVFFCNRLWSPHNPSGFPCDSRRWQIPLGSFSWSVSPNSFLQGLFNPFFPIANTGQETTSNTLSFLLMEAGRNPCIYQRLGYSLYALGVCFVTATTSFSHTIWINTNSLLWTPFPNSSQITRRSGHSAWQQVLCDLWWPC